MCPRGQGRPRGLHLCKLAPSSRNKRFKICFKFFFKSIPEHKTVSEALKTLYFLYFAFWSAGRWGNINPTLPATLLGYATSDYQQI